MIDYKRLYSTEEIIELCKVLDISSYEIGKHTKLTDSAVAKLFRRATKNAQKETRQIISDYINQSRRAESETGSNFQSTNDLNAEFDEFSKKLVKDSNNILHEAKILIESIDKDSNPRSKDKLISLFSEIVDENQRLKQNHQQLKILLNR